MDDHVDVYRFLNAGLRLYRDGLAFEAHEVWEHLWMQEVGRDKRTLQALIQIAAGRYKLATGVPQGAMKLLTKAHDRLEELLPAGRSCLGLDLAGLRDETAQTLAALAAGAPDPAFPTLPASVGPDRILYLHGFASGPGSTKARTLVSELRHQGFDVQCPDLNAPSFEDLTVTRAMEQAGARLADRTLIIGSSLGGYLGLLLAARSDRVAGLVALAPAVRLAANFQARMPEFFERWAEAGVIPVLHHASGHFQPIRFRFIEDAETHPAEPPVRVPTRIIQGLRDDTVPPEVVRVYAETAPMATLDLVDDDHSLVASLPLIRRRVAEEIARLGLRPLPPAMDAEEARKLAESLDP